MGRIFAVIERDLRKFRRNPIMMVMSVIMPLVYLVILGNSFQGTIKGLPLALVNLDEGPHGRRVEEVMNALEAGPGTVLIARVSAEGAAVEGVRDGLYKGALIIPAGFSRKIELKTGPELGLVLDNSDNISAASLTAAVESAVASLGVRYVPVRADLARVSLHRVELYRKVDYDQSLVPGVVVMAIFLGSMITGVFNLVMDRFLGADEALLLTPVTKTDVVVGLVSAGFIITMCIAVVVLSMSMLITRMPVELDIQRVLGLLAVLALTTLGLLSLMFLVLGRANHPRIVGVVSGFMNVIFFFPSGAVYPVESFPPWLRAFSAVNPEYYSVHALKAVLVKGSPLATVAGDLAFLAVFTAVTMGMAVVTFRRGL